MPRIYKRNCDECGKPYKSAAKRFCSRECMGKNADFRKKTGEKNKGKHPVMEFKKGVRSSPNTEFKRGMVPWNKDSKIQSNTGRTHIKKGQRISPSTEFKKGNIPPYKGKPYLAVRGENNNFWKGGITKLSITIRGCFKYRQWRSDVFTRDNFTCQECGARGVKINADHIKGFAQIMKDNNIKSLDEALDCEELWNINNGRTICFDCHKNTDTYLNPHYVR